MRKLLAIGAVLALAAPVLAQPTLDISLGTRETGSTAAIGENGGTSGSIEWVNLDGQSLILDGTWQEFTFDLDQAALTGFTGDGILDGAAGTIEHIRIKSTGYDGPITLWMDDVTDTITNAFGVPVPINFGDFEDPNVGDEYLFQEPGFSGSTDGNLDPAGANFAGVDDSMAHGGNQSYKIEWSFIDADPSRWIRLTTFTWNPTIAYDQDSVISFWIKGVPEPSSLALLALGGLWAIRRRR